MTAEDVTRASIGDRERVAVVAVARLELALVVDTPGIVGGVHRLGGLARVARILPPSLLLDHSVAGEQVADGGSGRPGDSRMSLPQDGQELLCAPVRMLATQLEDRLGDLDGGLVRTPFGPSRPFREAWESFDLEPLHPLVARGPADPVAVAELRHPERASNMIPDEQTLLLHG